VTNWLTRGMAALIAAGVLAPAPPAVAQTSSPAPVVVDRDMTPAAGAADVLAAQRLISSFEDRLLPARFSEATRLTHALGIAYRLGKWAAIDLPQDSFLMVAAHEVFGHGARLREIGASGVRYRFEAPPPYGAGSAATMFNGLSPGAAARADLLAIDTAGIEAQNVLADDIGEQALARGSLSYRAAWLYAQSRIAGLLYIRGVSAQSSPGHDVADFLHDVNDGCVPPACAPLDESTLKNRAMAMLADPMLAFSAYGFAVNYIVHGRTDTTVPMVSLPHGLRYLPAVGFSMTPQGTEWTTVHSFRAGGRLTQFTVRIGDTGAERTWGLGVRAARVAQRGRIDADLSADVWRQPALDATPSATRLMTGGLVATTIRVALGGSKKSSRVGLVGQAGYKSDGFVSGERLRAGAIIRAGLTIAFGVE